MKTPMTGFTEDEARRAVAYGLRRGLLKPAPPAEPAPIKPPYIIRPKVNGTLSYKDDPAAYMRERRRLIRERKFAPMSREDRAALNVAQS